MKVIASRSTRIYHIFSEKKNGAQCGVKFYPHRRVMFQNPMMAFGCLGYRACMKCFPNGGLND